MFVLAAVLAMAIPSALAQSGAVATQAVCEPKSHPIGVSSYSSVYLR